MAVTAVVSTVASVAGQAILGGKAASAQEKAAQTASDTQMKMFDITQGNLQPYMQTGAAGNNRLAELMGLDNFDRAAIGDQLKAVHPELYGTTTSTSSNSTSTPANQGTNPFNHTRPEFFQWEQNNPAGTTNSSSSSTSSKDAALNAAIDAEIARRKGDPSFGSLAKPVTMDQATLEQTPGYKFNLSQGLKSVQNSAAARGLGVSGAAFKGAAGYATGLADSTYQNQFSNAVTNQNNLFNRLTSITNTGQSAAANVGSMGTQVASNIGENTIGAGNAAAANYMNTGNAISGGVNSLGQMYMANQLMQGMYGSDARIKENITEMPYKRKGFPIYRFNYKGHKQRVEGVMASDVLKTRPDAVKEINGVLAVNYDLLGLRIRRVK